MTTINSNTIATTSLTACLGFLATTATAQLTLDAVVLYGQGLSPNGMVSADFDGDGDIDIATTTSGVLPDGVAVFLNAGDGTYAVSLHTALPTNTNPNDLVAGDLDGDLDIDLAVAVRNDPNGAIRIMYNNGSGTFTWGPTVPAGDRPFGMSIADMDGDGDLDIAAGSKSSDFVTVVTNVGGGVFSSTQLQVGPDPRSVAFGDFIPGGNLELAVSNHGDRTISLVAIKGSVLAEMTSLSIGSQNRPDGVIGADLNGDGLTDIAIATSHQTTPDFATIFLNTGTGFVGPMNYATGGTTSTYISAADLNCDGSLDLIVSNDGSNNVSLLENNGAGTFGVATLVSTGNGPSKAAIGDFDSDGSLDFSVSNTLSDEVSVVLNHTCIACVADITGDGFVDVADLLEVISVWGACPGGCAADINGDFVVDVIDLLEVVGVWGVCP